MPKICNPEYQQQLADAVHKFNMRSDWIAELARSNKEFTTNVIKTFDGRTIDARDVFAMSALLIKDRGNGDEEIKANFQADILKMEQAFANGPKEEVDKYIDQVFYANMNYKDDEIDPMNPDDAFKCVAIGAMGQAFGTKKTEYHDRFVEVFDTPEKMEDFFYNNIYVSDMSMQIYNKAVEVEPLKNGVTINTNLAQFDKYTNAIHAEVLNRDLEQYENYKNGKDDVVPFEFPVNPAYKKALAPKVSASKIASDMEIFTSLEYGLPDLFLPVGRVEDGKYVYTNGMAWKEALFINGKPLADYVSKDEYKGDKNQYSQAAIKELCKLFMDPEANIETLKIIPQGHGKFKRMFVPIHRDYKDVDPKLQEKHDAAFKKFTEETAATYRKEQNKYIDEKFKVVDEAYRADEIKDAIDKIPVPNKVGNPATWDNFDNIFTNEENLRDSFEELTKIYQCSNRYFKALKAMNPEFNERNECSIIELRQANQMAIFMAAGESANQVEFIKMRERIHNAFKGSYEEQREIFKEYVDKLHAFDMNSIDINSTRGLYKLTTFILATSAITNICESYPDFAQEIDSDIELKNDIANKVMYGFAMTEPLGEKLVQKFGSVPPGMFSHVNLRNDKVMDASQMKTAETKWMMAQLSTAKMGALYNDKKAAKLTIPYFFSGNACGTNGEKFTLDKAYTTVDQYLEMYNDDGRFVAMDQTMLEEAGIKTLVLGAAESTINNLDSVYSNVSNDTIQEFSRANGIKDVSVISRMMTYIDGRSLQELLDEKMASYLADKGLSNENLTTQYKNAITFAIASSIYAEALANPDKVITQVFLDTDKDNRIVPKTVVMKKDYAAMCQNAERQHSRIGRFFHRIGLHSYDEEKAFKKQIKAVKKFAREHKNREILSKFKEEHKAEFDKHQAEYGKTTEVKLEAMKRVDPERYERLKDQRSLIKNLGKEFKNEKVDVKETSKDMSSTSNRPNPTMSNAKLQSEKLQFQEKDAFYADDLETKNFENKFKVELDEKEDEIVGFDSVKDSPDQNSVEYDIEDVIE